MHRGEVTSFGRQLFQPAFRDERELKSEQRAERQHAKVRSPGCLRRVRNT